jgi:hypothetical protein
MDPTVIRIVAAVVAVIVGVLVFMRRRSRKAE